MLLFVVISIIVRGNASTFVIHVYSDGSIDATWVISGKYPGMYNSGNGTVHLVIHRDSFVFNASGTEIETGGSISDLNAVFNFLRSIPDNHTCIDKIEGSTTLLLANNSMISANYTLISTTDTDTLISGLNGTMLLTGTGEGVTTVGYIVNMAKDDIMNMLRSIHEEGVNITTFKAIWINNTTVKILFIARLNYTVLFDMPRNASYIIAGMNIPWRGRITYSLHWYNETGLTR